MNTPPAERVMLKRKRNETDKKTTTVGRRIVASLDDLVETCETGVPLEQKYVVTFLEIPEPGPYGPKEIKALRKKLKLSQRFFAHLIGAQIALVEKWERGERHPHGMARRLMDDINADPQRFLKMFMRHEKKAS